MRNRAGFTLVEILVVISILGILAGLVFSVGASVMLKSQIKGTQGVILTLSTACEQYEKTFGDYPNLDYPFGDSIATYPGNKNVISATTSTTSKYTDSNYQEFNKRLRYALEDRGYVIDEAPIDPFLKQTLPRKEVSDSVDDNRQVYVDTWGNPLCICPGRDHRKDVPVGPNNLSSDPNKSSLLHPKLRMQYPLDIFSTGPNGDNDVDAASGSSQQKTEFDTTVAGNDDITSWLIDVKYSDRNYGAKK